ncbi:NADP-dependent 3-hydroxy acid dehydrogenase YdfG [Nocardiopsis flavescens]|uniref:NADP-dependent 3-hydroxy acid dehydrogenase YdfG n=1 Tax=Nocardiopsis flavescens TaxID=758803 RepID=A0A1M6AYQ5_9ACTN|nr:SDR family oxidoreductase [Nocardiopsis flavescens]SHI41363.1 NADP-dependent 3-hydroxy acid dehydrogenase YdfG [Nocardiopsis flavescens]
MSTHGTGTAAQKVVLVTGAGSGIGEAVARRLAAQGHTVVLTGRRAERLRAVADDLTAAGHTARAHPLDVTDRAAFAALAAQAAAEHGRLDVLVANAGVMLLSRLESLLVDEWDRMFDVNVKGLYNGVAAVLPHFRAQGSGHVVTVASVGAYEVPPTSAVYSATKFAARALTEGLRVESDPSVRVTTVSPGVTESELAEHITDPYAADFMVEYRRRSIPADAVARAVAFALDQPADVDVNEIIVRPAAQR